MTYYACAFIDEANLDRWSIAKAVGRTVDHLVGTLSTEVAEGTIVTQFLRDPDFPPTPGLLVRSVWEHE